MTTKNVKQFLAQKMFNKWAKENKDFIDELLDLVYQGQLFKIKYGVGLEIKAVPLEEIKPKRNLGCGVVEKLFETQKYVNETTKNRKKSK